MEFIEVIKNRRAVRDYLDRAIDPSVVESLIAAAILAPSAMNLQPWSRPRPRVSKSLAGIAWEKGRQDLLALTSR